MYSTIQKHRCVLLFRNTGVFCYSETQMCSAIHKYKCVLLLITVFFLNVLCVIEAKTIKNLK